MSSNSNSNKQPTTRSVTITKADIMAMIREERNKLTQDQLVEQYERMQLQLQARFGPQPDFDESDSDLSDI